MEKNIVKQLNPCYYAMMFLAVLAATISYFLITRHVLSPVEPSSLVGMIVQYVVIFDALLTVPLGLYLFKRRCRHIAQIADEDLQTSAYVRAARVRIVMVSNAMILGMAAFYFLGGYTSMLWVAAIAAIGWYFTKPTEQKVYIELHIPESEQY